MARTSRSGAVAACIAALLVLPPAARALPLALVEREDVSVLPGLASAGLPEDVAVSPDGRHVYAVFFLPSALAVWARDPATGALEHVETQKNGISGVEHMSGPFSLVVSPDGAHVYAATFSSDAVVAFSRDPETGALDFLQAVRDGVGGFDGLDQLGGSADRILAPGALAVSPDGGSLYVAGAADDAVAALSRDPETGLLGFLEAELDGEAGVQGLQGAKGLALSPDGLHLYATGDQDERLAVFERDASGLLTFAEALETGAVPSGSLRNQSLALDDAGEHLYLCLRSRAAGTESQVVVYERDAETGLLTFVENGFGREGGGGVDILVDPAGDRVYVTLADALEIFLRDPESGRLSGIRFLDAGERGLASAFAPRPLAMSPEGRILYTGSLDATLAGFATTVFRPVEVLQGGFAGVEGLQSPFAVAVSPDGAHVYTASLVSDDVAAFARDAEDGTLDFLDAWVDGEEGVEGLHFARSVTLGPDGTKLYATGEFDSAVAAFRRDPTTGLLEFVEAELEGEAGVDGLAAAKESVVSADGRHLYVVGDQVALFDVEAGTGALDFASAMDLLTDTPRSLALSPDGAAAFLVGGKTLRPLHRNAETGSLTLGSAVLSASDPLRAVLASPDGRHVLALADGQILALEASPSRIGVPDVQRDDTGAVDGLAGARDLAISPDGRLVAAVSASPDDALAVFARDPLSGELTFLQSDADTDGYGATSLDGASGVAFSPDGRFLYVVSEYDEQLTVFAPEPSPELLGALALATLALARRLPRERRVPA